METLRPNKKRAKIAMLFVYIVMAFDVISIFSDYLQYNLLIAASEGEIINEDEVLFNDLRQQLIAVVYLLMIITSGILFILWFRRAYYNLHQKTEYLSYSEGWAAGSWFVPVLCLFRPFQIMKELYVETDKILSNRLMGYQAKINTWILGSWWALWIINNFLGNIIFRTSINMETIEGIMTNTELSMVSSGIGIILGFLTVNLIKNYSEMETLLFELPGEQPGNLEQIPATNN